jgi:hypothetical protein
MNERLLHDFFMLLLLPSVSFSLSFWANASGSQGSSTVTLELVSG